jgi:hypothetical protein
MKRSDAFPSKYLGKDDVDPPRLGTISSVRIDTLKSDDGAENKPVMYFREEVLKPLILNNTNWTICEEAYGEDSDTWAGKKLELYHDPTIMFGKKRVGGVRVRIPANGNGHTGPAAPDILTMPQALEMLAAVGIEKESFKAELLAAGSVNADGVVVYVPKRDTALVRRLLAQNSPPEQDEEPF